MLSFIESAGSSASSNNKSDRTLPALGRRKGVVLGGVALALMVLGSSAAQAEDCTIGVNIGGNVVFGFGASVAATLNSTIAQANTAFLTQSSAFVGNPSNPQPNQTGGGVWVRGVGGETTLKSTAAGTGSITPLGSAFSGPINCNSKVQENFGGVQVGQDISKLNIDGWNVHFGTTAGEISTQGHTVGGNFLGGSFTSNVQVPFIGAYAAVNKGGFFADALVRGDFYQAQFDSPSFNIFKQNLNARGLSISGSTGYHFDLPNANWFVEPSVGVIWSRVSVDPMNLAGPSTNAIQGTLQENDIVSTTGRAGLRVGTTVSSGNVIWQPFAAASVWSDFGATSSGSFTSCGTLTGGNTCAVVTPGPVPVIGSGSGTTTGIGTYGQYSLGISGQVVNTGWLGFARVDFRDGDRLEGWDVTGGIRYQFTPDLKPKGLIIAKAPMAPPYNWTGLYVGGFLGADRGWTREDFRGAGGIGDVGPNVQGLIGGGQIGYNYQVGTWVWGIEGDLGATNTKGSKACTDLSNPGVLGGFQNPPPSALWNMTCNTEANWIATVTGRVGITWDRALLYVKGGGAFTHETISDDCNLGPGNGSGAFYPNCINTANVITNHIGASANLTGWTVGYGTEFALTRNWSAKAEWDYVNFGSKNVVASDGTAINAGMSINAVKVGANYHFTP